MSCGGTTNYTDTAGISWIPDSAYISTGSTTSIGYTEGNNSSSTVTARFFPGSQGRNCYRIPVKNMSSLVLVRAQFVYKNYDGRGKAPAFSVSLGTAVLGTMDMTEKDPLVEEFVWPVNKKETLSFCLLGVKHKGSPLISSLEVRPLPEGAYTNGMEDFPNKSLRKSYRINCGYTNGSLRYELFAVFIYFYIYTIGLIILFTFDFVSFN